MDMNKEARVRRFAFENFYEKKVSVLTDTSDLPPVVSFKRLVGAPTVALPETLPALGTLAEAFSGFQGTLRQVESPRLAKVASLLANSLGLMRREVIHRYNPHRAVPSPRCLYPSELYVWLNGGADAVEGIYHYLPAEHALELVRPGGRGWLEASLGVSLDTVEAVALLSLEFWRVGIRYGEFSYRLCLLEAGHLAGNLLLVGSGLGWEGQLRYQFVDGWIEQALGLEEGEERCVGAVLLGRKLSPSLDTLEFRKQPEGLGPLQGRWRASGATASTQQLAGLREAVQAATLESLGECRRPPGSIGQDTTPPPVPAQGFCEALSTRWLETALFDRNSGFGPQGLAPSPVPLPGPLVREAMAAGMSAYRHDSGPTARVRPLLDLYAVALHVQSVETGIYRYRPEKGELELIQPKVDGWALQKNYLVPDAVNVCAHGLVWFLATDVDAAFALWGARGYQILQLEAGLVAQWLSICLASPQHFVRPSLSYSERGAEQLLGLTGNTSTVVYQLLAGTTRYPGFHLDLRLWNGAAT